MAQKGPRVSWLTGTLAVPYRLLQLYKKDNSGSGKQTSSAGGQSKGTANFFQE